MNSWPTYLVDLQTLLILIRLLVLILIQGKLKPISLILSVALSLTSSIIFYSNIVSISANSMQFDTNIAKINFTITYLMEVTQD